MRHEFFLAHLVLKLFVVYLDGYKK